MRSWGALPLLLVLPLLAAVPAQAQPETCSLVLTEADRNPETTGFQAADTRVYAFDAQNTGSLQATADVVITAPQGGSWQWTFPLPSLTVPAGNPPESTVSFSVNVTYTGGAATSAVIDLSLANVECSLVVGTIEGPSSGPIELSFTGILPRSPTDGDGFPWALLVFALIVLAAVILAPMTYLRKRVAVEAFCEDPERDVVAGRGTSFPIVLRNKGTKAVHVSLVVTDVQEGWSGLVTLPDVELGPKESRTLYMMVRAPAEARPGDLCVAKLRVTPQGGRPTVVSTISKVAPAGSQPAEEKGGGKKGATKK